MCMHVCIYLCEYVFQLSLFSDAFSLIIILIDDEQINKYESENISRIKYVL